MSYELAGILLTVVVQALYIAFKIGKFEEKLNSIEKKQDKHNNLIERMVRVEDSVKSAHKRLDDILFCFALSDLTSSDIEKLKPIVKIMLLLIMN